MSIRSVSIIIPIYNCEEYIEACIESVLAQGEAVLEILLIDDGSTDSSGTICDKYASKYTHVKVFHIANGGVSYARNLGITYAKGAYIQFVDGDDSIKPTMTDTLTEAMEESGADLVVCGYDRITKYIRRKDKLWDKPGTYDSKEYVIHTLHDPTGYYYGVVWNKLYQSKIIKQNLIMFQEGMKLGEDFVFNLEVLKHSKKIHVIRDRLYVYNYANTGTLSKYKENTVAVYKCELANRNAIFKAYQSCFRYFHIELEYEQQLYNYWRHYYARAMYEIKHGLHGFSEADKQEWKDAIMANSSIMRLDEELSDFEKGMAGFGILIERAISMLKKPIKQLSLLAKMGKGYLVNRL